MLKAILLTAALAQGQFAPDNAGWFPRTEEPYLQDLVKLRPKFYDHEPAYQNGGGVHSPAYNIAAGGDRPFGHGNANREFPWKHTAGIDDTSHVKVLRFVHLPGPIKYWRDGDTIRWQFPNATIFGEILLLWDGRDYRTFEVRTRERLALDNWLPRIFVPDFKLPGKRHKIVGAVLSRQVSFAVVDVGEVDPARLDVAFIERETKATVYTTASARSVVPKGYQGTLTSCVVCHKTVQVQARVLDAGRDWYGRVRGSDQIFSFSIFDPSCISRNGFTLPVRLSQGLVDAGLLVRK